MIDNKVCRQRLKHQRKKYVKRNVLENVWQRKNGTSALSYKELLWVGRKMWTGTSLPVIFYRWKNKKWTGITNWNPFPKIEPLIVDGDTSNQFIMCQSREPHGILQEKRLNTFKWENQPAKDALWGAPLRQRRAQMWGESRTPRGGVVTVQGHGRYEVGES